MDRIKTRKRVRQALTACTETVVAARKTCSAPVRTIPRRTAVLAVRVVDRRDGIYAAAAGLRRQQNNPSFQHTCVYTLISRGFEHEDAAFTFE